MNPNSRGPASNAWHHYGAAHSVQSSRAVVPFVMSLVPATSVIDVGCGVGQWLRVFKECGVDRVIGIDGGHVPRSKRLINPDEFIEADLSSPPELNDRFDLVVSLEVAEHLRPDLADNFCDYLVTLGNTLLFSAAIPGQTGENHVNEQPHEYWHEKFRARGYEIFDVFRLRFWHDDRVNWWYRQNMYLITRDPISTQQPLPKGGYTAIHPEMFEMYSRRIDELEHEIEQASPRLRIKDLLRAGLAKISNRQ